MLTGSLSAERSVTLSWNPSPDPSAVGAFVLYGEPPGNYTHKVDVGARTNHTIQNLIEGRTYSFYVTAYNADRIESDPSNSVEFQAVMTPEDQPAGVLLSGLLPSIDWASFVLVDPPTHGILDGTAPDLVYRPDPDHHGKDTFTYTINEGLPDVTSGTIGILIEPVNDPPIAQALNLPANAGEAVPVQLSGTDPDGDLLSYTIEQVPSAGNLIDYTPEGVTYLAPLGFAGLDTFVFTVSDGFAQSSPAAITITVSQPSPVNRAPQAVPGTWTTLEDQALSVNLASLATDPDGDTLSFAIIEPPTHGLLTGAPPALTYIPAQDYAGPDSFQFTASDGVLETDPTSAQITVTPLNDPPVALSQSFSTTENSSIEVILTGTDVDGDTLQYRVVTAPRHGAVFGSSPRFTYQPTAGFTGVDTLEFVASDGAIDSARASITITVASANRPPQVEPATLTTLEDQALAIDLHQLASDPEGDALTYTIVIAPTHGTLSGAPPSLTYLPQADYAGSDTLSFRASDGQQESVEASIRIEISPVNDPPVAEDRSYSMNQDGTLAIALSGSDVEGAQLVYQVVSQPAQGTLSGTPPTLTYQPLPGTVGSDSFGFVVSDGLLTSDSATVSIAIRSANQAPIAEDLALSTREDKETPVNLRATDPDGDPLEYRITTPPQHGVVDGTPPHLVYSPHRDYNGPDLMEFTASDGSLSSAPGKVQIDVQAVNDAPKGNGGIKDVPGRSGGPPGQNKKTYDSVSITLTGFDPDDDALSFEVSSLPRQGVLTGQAPELVYTPGDDFAGLDRFTFTVQDDQSVSAPAEVWLLDPDSAYASVQLNHVVTWTSDGHRVLSLQLAQPIPTGLTLETSADMESWLPVITRAGGQSLDYSEIGIDGISRRFYRVRISGSDD